MIDGVIPSELLPVVSSSRSSNAAAGSSSSSSSSRVLLLKSFQQCTNFCSKLSRTAGNNAMNNTLNSNGDSSASLYGPSNPNPFLQLNVPAAGAKFVSRVLEKGGLPGTYVLTCMHS
jgi:hypothetical protein